jgi:hypothetical protein
MTTMSIRDARLNPHDERTAQVMQVVRDFIPPAVRARESFAEPALKRIGS